MNTFIANEELSNLKKAVEQIRTQTKRQQNKNNVLAEFDKLPLNERQLLFREYKRNKQDICFIKEYDKLYIMGYFKN